MVRILTFCVTMAGLAPTAMAQVVVIANKSVPVTSIVSRELIDIYTLNIQRWEDGTRITVYDIKGGGRVKEAFYGFLEIKPEAMKRVWIGKQFSGKAMPPQTEESEQEIVDHVARTPGAIAYVSTGAARGRNDVKIIIEIR